MEGGKEMAKKKKKPEAFDYLPYPNYNMTKKERKYRRWFIGTVVVTMIIWIIRGVLEWLT